MSKSMPVTAGTPANDLTRACSLIAPPFTGTVRSGGNSFCEPGEVCGEPFHVVPVVLNRQQPLLHLPPRREKHPVIVLHKPVQVAKTGINFEKVPKVANPLAAERHTPLGADGHHVPTEIVL